MGWQRMESSQSAQNTEDRRGVLVRSVAGEQKGRAGSGGGPHFCPSHNGGGGPLRPQGESDMHKVTGGGWGVHWKLEKKSSGAMSLTCRRPE